MPDQADIIAFAQALTALQRSLYVYIVKLLGRPADAEDVLQEVNRVLWEKLADYRPGTSFAAWAYRVAHYEVLTFRKRRARDRLRLDDGVLALLAEEAAAEPDECDALRGCLDKLPPADRDLITRRYQGGDDLRALARHYGRSEPSLCRSLARVRAWLADCIRSTTELHR